MAKADKKLSAKEAILETARKRFDLAVEAESDIRRDALDDLKFRVGEQWPEEVKAERARDGRPCLVINRIPQFIRQITNDQRQNRPSIKVHPVDDNADIDTAKILQGLVRHIEYNSSADLAYDRAFEGAAQKGFGYFRIITDYVDPYSFEQEILIKSIRNHFSVYLDPFSKEPDGSDANWGFVFDDVPKEEFELEYPDAELTKMDDWTSIGDVRQGWVTKESVRVAEYFYKELRKVDLVQLSDGTVIEKPEAQELFGEDFERMPEGLTVMNQRASQVPVVKWCKINGLEILEESEWAGRWVPIIPVYGDEVDVDGKRILEGITRHAKDSQRMLNYWASTETETIALAPRAPFIAAEGQITKENEAMWRSANRKNYAFLPYKPTTIGGQLAPPPQRNIFEPPVQAITNARMLASEDIKATTGIFDAALGNQSNETSGVAIRSRAYQAQTSNYHFIDNLTRSLAHAGRIIIDLIPKIYDTPRAARIIGEEGQQEIVRINEYFEKSGQSKIYNFGVGKYDVTVETGPSFATKRQEAAASMVEITRAYPQLAQVAGDLLIKNMDWPGSSEIAERLKKTLPPEVLGEEGDQKMPPQAQAQMQQMDMLIKDLAQKLQAAEEDIKTKRIELESEERIAFAKMENDLQKELLKQEAQGSISSVISQINEINQRLEMLGINEPMNPEDRARADFLQSNGFVPQQEEEMPTGGFEPGQQLPFQGGE